MSELPLVSIGMPVYNEERFLAATLEAILTQDYPHFELIVSDNASTDRTPAILAEYAARDARIKSFRNESNQGALKNFNRVFELAEGEFFAWAGGHDRWQPTFLSRCLEPLRDDPDVVLAHPKVLFIDADDKPIRPHPGALDTRDHRNRLTRFNIVIWSLGFCFEVYGLMRSSAVRRTALFQASAAPDYVFIIEMSFLGTFAHVPEVLLLGRREVCDPRQALEKCFVRAPSRLGAELLFWKFVARTLRAIVKHVRTLRGKLAASVFFTLCAAAKFGWLLKYARAGAKLTPDPEHLRASAYFAGAGRG